MHLGLSVSALLPFSFHLSSFGKGHPLTPLHKDQVKLPHGSQFTLCGPGLPSCSQPMCVLFQPLLGLLGNPSFLLWPCLLIGQVSSQGLTWSSGSWRPSFLLLFLCTLAGSAAGLPISTKALILPLPGEFACWWGELGPSPEIALTQRELLCPRLCPHPRVNCLQ